MLRQVMMHNAYVVSETLPPGRIHSVYNRGLSSKRLRLPLRAEFEVILMRITLIINPWDNLYLCTGIQDN